jgi:hypothetical protein
MLDSFRELLVKKSDRDPNLQTLVKLVKEDALLDIVMESLEKMARAGHKGDSANLAIRDFGLEMDPELEPTMIHDAVSHHASRYKAALKHLKDNPDDQKVKDAFNHHAGEIFKLVNMAEKTQKHTHGKLDISAPSPHAWERNIKPDQFNENSKPVLAGKKKVGQFVTDTKGWNYKGGYKDNGFEFLTQPPHPAYTAEAQKQGWGEGAYPMEKIKVNDKHLNINDNISRDDLISHQPHEFDAHPIMDHYHISPSKRTPEQDSAYMEKHDEFHQNIPDSWWDKHESMSEDHGKNMSAPVHEHGVTLMGKGQTKNQGGSSE